MTIMVLSPRRYYEKRGDYMKKFCIVLAAVSVLLSIFFAFAGCMSTGTEKSQGSGKADKTTAAAPAANNTLGDYTVEIKSCRQAKDYAGKPVAIVTYGFTNNGDEATSFMIAVNDKVYQNGVECPQALLLDESANYDADAQMKNIKKGTTLTVEVAYEIDAAVKKLDVEVSELISLSDDTLTKTFTLS